MGTDSADDKSLMDGHLNFTQLVIQEQQKSSAFTKAVSMNNLSGISDEQLIDYQAGPNSQNVSINNPLEIMQAKPQKGQPINFEELRKQVEDNKLFLNMVVHDMRSPTVSIKLGLDRTKNFLDEILGIISDLDSD